MTTLLLALLAGSGWMAYVVERQRRIQAEKLSGTYFGAVLPKPRDPEPDAESRALAAAKQDAESEVVTRLQQGLNISAREAHALLRKVDGYAE